MTQNTCRRNLAQIALKQMQNIILQDERIPVSQHLFALGGNIIERFENRNTFFKELEVQQKVLEKLGGWPAQSRSLD